MEGKLQLFDNFFCERYAIYNWINHKTPLQLIKTITDEPIATFYLIIQISLRWRHLAVGLYMIV